MERGITGLSDYNALIKVLHGLNIKRNMFYSMLHIPALWYFDTSVIYLQWFRRVRFVVLTPRFVWPQYLWNIAIQPAAGCYNSWANIRCSGCSPPGKNVVMMTSSNGNIFRVTGPLCGEFTGPGEFPTQRPVTGSFDVFFDQRLNKRLSKQPWGWWLDTPSWSL